MLSYPVCCTDAFLFLYFLALFHFLILCENYILYNATEVTTLADQNNHPFCSISIQ